MLKCQMHIFMKINYVARIDLSCLSIDKLVNLDRLQYTCTEYSPM